MMKARSAWCMSSFDFLSPWEGTDYVLPGDEKAAAPAPAALPAEKAKA
jgi:NADH-quinone oxidoreductase subunit C